MARDIAGGHPDHAARRFDKKAEEPGAVPIPQDRHQLLDRLKARMASEREVEGSTRYWVRIVFFGAAQFGHGRRGPLPRKALIRALGVRCPVILMDEYNTSKRCCDCGDPLVPVPGSRVFQCVRDEGHDGDLAGCTIRFINRDVNGAENIAKCGVCQLLGVDRPHYLQNPQNNQDHHDEDDE